MQKKALPINRHFFKKNKIYWTVGKKRKTNQLANNVFEKHDIPGINFLMNVSESLPFARDLHSQQAWIVVLNLLLIWWNSKVTSLKIPFHALFASASSSSHLSQLQRNKETEELLKWVGEKQNATSLPMQHTNRNHIMYSFVSVNIWICFGVSSSTLLKLWWHRQPCVGHKSSNAFPMRDLGSTVQEPTVLSTMRNSLLLFSTTKIFMATSCW